MSILVREASYLPIRRCEKAPTFKHVKDPEDNKMKWTPCSPSDP